MSKYKVKSDYTLLKKRSQLIPGGTVYENNYMTISPMDDLFAPGQYITNTDSNFRFSVNTSYNAQKRHTRNGWVKPDTCIDKDENCEYWTMDNLGEGSISEESEIRIKPDYTSLRDFAYYGSAVEMIRATVNNVILNFPAELYFSSEEFKMLNDDGTSYDQYDGGYIIPNGYGINVDLPYVNENSVYNPLRYLCLSIDNYDLYKDGKFVASGLSFDVKQSDDWLCENNMKGGIFAEATIKGGGVTLTIYVYKKGDEKVLYYKNTGLKGYSIRPCEVEVNRFYNTLDDFGNVLLDRSTNPRYMSVFETPYETDRGNVYRMEPYIWPAENDWNPNVDGASYERFLSRLIDLAQFSDLYDSNIIWRMMTHEAIKNLDWTFTRSDGEDTGDYSVIDSTRVEAMMQIWGRNFDGLKRYIDNIKNSNKITYDERNNVPDYELSDFVDLSGWDTFVIKPKARTDVFSKPIYPNRSKGFSEVDMNTTFMRVMKLNSNYINSMKGTVKGIETMLGILGLKDDEYSISEYVSVAYGNDDGCLIDTVHAEHIGMEQNYIAGSVKYPAYSTIAAINSFVNVPAYSDGGENGDWLDGIAVKPVISRDKNSIYVVPWYDINKRYAGNWWYQCNGGWGRRKTKTVINPFNKKEVELNNVYDETESSLLFFNTIDEMLSIPPSSVYCDMVAYVTNLNDISRYDGSIPVPEDGEYSHYFILKCVSKFGVFGEEGWRYVPKSELEAEVPSDDAKKVIFLETIKESTEGNNPHCGKGKYDCGREYLDCMNQIFKNASDDDLQTFTNNDKGRIYDFTFNIDNVSVNNNEDEDDGCECEKKDCCNCYPGVNDDSRVWYFPNDDVWKDTNLFHADEKNGKWSNQSEVKTADLKSTCKYSISPENGVKDYEEPAANSVINRKNVQIMFNMDKIPSDILKDWKDYIENIVVEYLKQVIPSTTIFEYGFSND